MEHKQEAEVNWQSLNNFASIWVILVNGCERDNPYGFWRGAEGYGGRMSGYRNFDRQMYWIMCSKKENLAEKKNGYKKGNPRLFQESLPSSPIATQSKE